MIRTGVVGKISGARWRRSSCARVSSKEGKVLLQATVTVSFVIFSDVPPNDEEIAAGKDFTS